MDLSIHIDETIMIRGILVPVSWDTTGKIVCLAVSTFDELEYRIAGDDAAGRWRDYLNLEVAIQGRPFQHGLEQWIAVQSLQAVQSECNPNPNTL